MATQQALGSSIQAPAVLSPSAAQQERVAFVDFIRVVACFMVILVHSSEHFYGGVDSPLAGPVSFLANETDRLCVSLYDGFCRMSVPLFMIVSAYLLAPMKEGVSSWQFYRRRLLRVGPPMLLFLVLYSVLPLLWGGVDTATAMHDLSRVLINFPDGGGHLWFMYPLLSLYLFIPIISPWLRQATKGEELFFIGLFAVSTCLPYLNRWCGDVFGECFWNSFNLFHYFAGYLGYLVLAHYIRVHLDWSRARRVAVGVPCLVVGAAATILSFYVQGVPGQNIATPVLEVGWAFCTLNVLCETFGAFLLFSCIRRPRAPRCIEDISRMSFGMYLVHIFWLNLWAAVFQPVLPTPVAIPVMAVVTYLCSYVTVKLLSYLPGAKYLIGAESRCRQTK